MAYPALDLAGKVAVVTGGNSGIGLGMAAALAGAGADVCIWGTNHDKNEHALEELEQHGTHVLTMVCNVGDEDAVQDSFAATVDQLGRVDACFANAGVAGIGRSFTDLNVDEWRRLLNVNLDGTFFTLRAAARHMIERGGGGSLVAVSSLAAIQGQPRGQHYAASKGALISMIRGLAVELAPYHVRANAVLPGWVDTPLVEPLLSWDRFQNKILPRIPAGRWGRPADFGGIAVYLASDAAAWHTGDSIVVDGGFSIG